MVTEIIVAVIAGVGAIGGSWLVNNANVAVLQNQIETLSERVRVHNQIIDRTYRLETDVAVLQNRNSVNEHRVEDLEESVKALENAANKRSE